MAHHSKLVALRAFGRFTYEAKSPHPTTTTLFDIASVTKVLATTSMAMILYERGLLDLDTPLISIVGEFSGEDPRRDEVTLRMLLAHSSGLPAYEKLFLRAHTRDQLLEAAFTTALANDPGSHAEYSDIGFILLGVALERLADETLDRFCQREILGPLGMTHTTFNPAAPLRPEIPPTANDQTFRHRIIREKFRTRTPSVLGGVAGHAGLFSMAQDALYLRPSLLLLGRQSNSSSRNDLTLHRGQSAPEGVRALGWDTPSAPSQSAPLLRTRFRSPGIHRRRFGIDPERELSVTLLTNRTWPDCTNQAIKQVRPKFHDAVLEILAAAL